MTRKIVSVVLLVTALAAVWRAATRSTRAREFQNPITYTMADGVLYVVEKEGNTILELELLSPARPPALKGRSRIEKDDPDHYYMVRHLYPGPSGVVTHSFIYEQATKKLVGYRFRLYRSFREPPRELFTIFLKYPEDFSELSYNCDREGNHYFINNCRGQRNIWKIPAGMAGVVMKEGVVPSGVEELGELKETPTFWLSVHVGPDGRIFASSGEEGRIVEYSPRGARLGEIGEVEMVGEAGAPEGRLLSPAEVFHLGLEDGEPEYLTVASTGNRTWVQFDREGRLVRAIKPRLEKGEDILVGRIYRGGSGLLCSFDLANKRLLFHGPESRTWNRQPPKPREVFWCAAKACRSYQSRDRVETALLYGAAVLLFLGAFFHRRLAARLAGLRYPLFFKLLVLFLPVVIGGLIIASGRVERVMKEALIEESVRRSANLARAVLSEPQLLEDLEKIQKPPDRESEAYGRIFNMVNRLLDREKVEYTPKWIIHKIRDGKYFFGINIWRGPIYEPFIVPGDRPMFRDVLEKKECRYGSFIDDQGEWFSYLCPITDKAGEVIYVLELYRSTEEIRRLERDVAKRVKEGVAGTALSVTALILVFSYLFTRPLKKLTRGTRVVSSGDFDYRFDVRSRDEVGELARAFDQMVVDLKKYTRELARATAEKERIQSELRLAREMQQGILPRLFPPEVPPESVEIFACMEPAKEVGGDFYDFFPVDDRHIGVVIADVAGKGVPAGLFMMVARALLRNNAVDNLSAADALTKVNKLLCADNSSSTFVTLFYFICDLETGRLTFCNAGHNPPIVMKKSGVKLLKSNGGDASRPALGIIEDAVFRDETLTLAPGETILLYTDGVTEAINPRKKMFGEDRLIEFVSANPALPIKELGARLLGRLVDYGEGLEQFDDITVLFFKFAGTS